MLWPCGHHAYEPCKRPTETSATTRRQRLTSKSAGERDTARETLEACPSEREEPPFLHSVLNLFFGSIHFLSLRNQPDGAMRCVRLTFCTRGTRKRINDSVLNWHLPPSFLSG